MTRMRNPRWKRSLFGAAFVVCAAAGLVGCSNDDDLAATPPLPGVATVPVQVDRMGIATINTVLIAANRKDVFNQSDPAGDVQTFTGDVVGVVNSLRARINAVPGFPAEDSPGVSAEAVAATVLPDVITIDLSRPVVFPNGRRLEDDVIDVLVGVVINRGNALGGGPGVSDGVANDSVFLNTFPYMGPPR